MSYTNIISRIVPQKVSKAATSLSIAHIIINRPSCKNAVDRPTAEELVHAFQTFEKDDSLAVAVLSGAENNFCSGADLKAVAEGVGSKRINDVSKLGPMGPSGMLKSKHLTKPVIAAIEGYSVAGGFELACWADLRVVAQGAKMGVLCRRVGVPLIDGGTVRLPRLIGQSRALDLILTGRMIEAKEAYEFGLANRLVKEGTAVEEAIELASALCKFPQTCMRNDRRSVYSSAEFQTEEEALWNELRIGQETLASGETVSGAKQFAAGSGRGGRSF